MTKNTKPEVNITNTLSNNQSNFRRMLKTNIARSAAMLALISAPLMESNAGPNGYSVNAKTAMRGAPAEIGEYVKVEQAANGAQEVAQAATESFEVADSLWSESVDLFGRIFYRGCDTVKNFGANIINEMKDHPGAVVGTVAALAALYAGYRGLNYVNSHVRPFTDSGKLTSNFNKMSNCIDKLENVLVDCKSISDMVEEDAKLFDDTKLGVNFNGGNKEEATKILKETLDNNKARFQKTVEEVEKLQAQVAEMKELYVQTLITIDVNVISKVAERKISAPKADSYTKLVISPRVHTLFKGKDGIFTNVFDPLEENLSKIKEIEENYSGVMTTAGLSVPGVGLERLQTDLAKQYKTLKESLSESLNSLRGVRDNLNNIRTINRVLKELPEPSSGWFKVFKR